MDNIEDSQALKLSFTFSSAADQIHDETSSSFDSGAKRSPPRWEKCIFCEASFDLNNLHPGHVKAFGTHPRVCRRCGLCFNAYGKIWSDGLEARIGEAKMRAGRARKCFLCHNAFNLLGSFYRHFWYNWAQVGDDNFHESHPQWGYWVNSDGMDFLYPNLFTSICPECFQRTLGRDLSPDPTDQLNALNELGTKLGKLPIRNFPMYIYSYDDKENIEWFLRLLARLPDPELITVRFGSYFQMLLKSGLLPDGTRRMRLGTWSVAKDGDLCFSLVEREIDNWLFNHNIAHTKEVKYPNSDMRCDWELFRNGKRMFIEYFGLMNRKTYATKAEQKRTLANTNGIELLAITPEMDWEKALRLYLLEQKEV